MASDGKNNENIDNLERIIENIGFPKERVIRKYNHLHKRKVTESYDLMTDFIMDGWDIGDIIIDEEENKVFLTLNLPFYDSKFIFYSPDKNTYMEFQISGNQERYLYKKIDETWRLTYYKADKPRKEKLDIIKNGFESKGKTIIEGVYDGLRFDLEDTTKIILMGNEYNITNKELKKDKETSILNIGVNWLGPEGEELVRIKDDLLISTQNFDDIMVPLAGRIELIFPKLYDLKIPVYGQIK